MLRRTWHDRLKFQPEADPNPDIHELFPGLHAVEEEARSPKAQPTTTPMNSFRRASSWTSPNAWPKGATSSINALLPFELADAVHVLHQTLPTDDLSAVIALLTGYSVC